MKTLQESLLELAESVLGDDNTFVLDVDIKSTGKQTILSVYVDTAEGGVNIDQCAKISRELSFLIESNELVTDKFTLNVSSPGLDRPLSDERQFQKNINRKASAKIQNSDGVKTIKGTFCAFDGVTISLDLGKEGIVQIPREEITEFKILPAF